VSRSVWLFLHGFMSGSSAVEKVMSMRSSMRTIVATMIVTLVVAPILTMFLGADSLSAQNLSPEYTFLVASGFLCDSGTCPAGAKSVNGDTYEITGAGTFNAQSKSVSAAGTFTHKIPNGTMVETGVWTSNQLISFDLYGAAPNALRQRGIAAGVPGFRPNLLPMSVSPVPVGGLAVFRIRLLPASGMPMSAVLQVNCALADAPRDRSADGIRLKLERNLAEFSEELGGSVMFLAIPPQPAMPDKGKQQEPHSGATPTPNN
jgi:hypothetical protein